MASFAVESARVGRRWRILRALPVAILIVSALAGATAHAAERRSLAELMMRAQSRGSVRVMAELALPAGAQALQAEDSGARRTAIAQGRLALTQALAGRRYTLTREYHTLPYVALEVSPEALDALEKSGAVRDVFEDRLESVQLPQSGPLVQADQAWAAGDDGSGWAIAILDTGVASTHPFLAGKVVTEACFSANGSCPNGSTAQFGPGAAVPCPYAPNTCQHGTHVAGIAAGRGQDFSGIARGASIIAIQVFSRFSGADNCAGEREDPCAKSFTSDTVAALEYLYELRQGMQIAAANLSLGGGSFNSQAACDQDNPARTQVVENLRAAGIATVAAAGNQSNPNALSAPACMSAVVSVGATTKDDQIASFSNSASFLSLLAPGTPIYSSVPPDGFAFISGTSQATPHVAGAFAILYQRMGSASVDTALGALQSTGLPILDSRNGLAKPRIRIFDALQTLPTPGTPSGLQITPDRKHTLISKDVNGERWAIATNGGTTTVTGNVFRPDGGEPTFLWCQQTGTDGNPDPAAVQILFACQAAGNCTSPSCPAGQWAFASNVTLPGSFFLPPSSSNGSSPIGTTVPDVASALQITPDSQQTLVSKDVGGERWAIARNADDGSVTGNVYAPDGREPQFVWCQFLSSDGNPDPNAVMLTYACSVANRCTDSTCAPAEWAFFSNVTLPGSFFQPR